MKNFLRQAAQSFSLVEGAKEVIRIYQPFLQTWGFENFYYVRITRKRELIYLTNNVGFALDYWDANLPLRTGFDTSTREVQCYTVQWGNNLEKEILDFSKDYRCYDGFSFVNRYYDTIQFSSFFRSSPLENASKFYMNSLTPLSCWLRDFEWKMRGVIKQAKQKPMILPEEYLDPQKETFYPERKIELQYRNIHSKITFRELDCLHLHSRGFSCSYIAAILGLSPRTVETHFESIKNRFGFSTRNELSKLAYTNSLIQSYSPRI